MASTHLRTRSHLRQDIVAVCEVAIRAVDPRDAILANVSVDAEELRIGDRAYPLGDLDRVLVVGAGKAGTPMAAAVYGALGDRITTGFVNVKYGYNSAAGEWHVRFGGGDELNDSRSEGRTSLKAFNTADTGPVEIKEAGHPIPDAAGLAGAERIGALLAGLTDRDLVLVLLSGGGSALLPLPVEGISLEDYQQLTDVLLRSGADIAEINTLRKHCSRLQGGQLARLAAPAQVAALILSDVVGTPLDAIASGPTVPDHSTFADALDVVQRYGIADDIPDCVRKHLQRGVAGDIPDTPKAGEPLFEHVNTVVIGDNAVAGHAAVAEATRLGYHSVLLTTFVQGESREVGRAVAGLGQGIASGQSDYAPPACLVLGGETTVTIRGGGLGGRNQELALSAALTLDGYALGEDREVAVVSLGTDGTDGPTGAAGAIATLDTMKRARAAGLDVRAALANNDSYHFLGALGDLLITGPTQTNVNDLILVLVR
jgi:hydroxypyruvate reductase